MPAEPWMQTYTGLKFSLVPDDYYGNLLSPLDIAHGLSNICRWGGHVKEFYCPTPEQRILTNDLRWVAAGDLKVGDGLLGFDEYPHELGGAGKRHRRFRPAQVLTAIPVKRHVYRLEMEDGSTIRSSVEHPWLVATKMSRNQSWRETGALVQALLEGKARYMHKFMTPWSACSTLDGAWLAGVSDGEGSLSLQNRRGSQLQAIVQNPGVVLDKASSILTSLGFEFGRGRSDYSKVAVLQVRGGFREMLRYLGSIRPVRLLENFSKYLSAGDFNKQLSGESTPSKIVACYDEGEQWCAGIESSTRTYFCEGYGAHNSVAQHSVLVSYACQTKPLAGLLHDASEAFLGDIISPLKSMLPGYKELEHQLQDVIAFRFGLDGGDLRCKEVVDADMLLLAMERRDLLTTPNFTWSACPDIPPPTPSNRINPVSPHLARKYFMDRFYELTGVKGRWKEADEHDKIQEALEKAKELAV